MTEQKILVGIPTYAGGKYCRDILIKSLSALSTKNLSFLFVTNSGIEDKKELEEKTKILSATVLLTKAFSDTKQQIVHNRNVLRDYCLENNYDYLHFIDHDVLQPKDAIDVLLSHNKKLITGWYINIFTYDGQNHTLPMVYFPDSPGRSRQLSMIDVLVPRLFKINCAGLGCTLIHRGILKQVPFAVGEGTEDSLFYETVRQKCKKDLWIDTRVACVHLKFPLGDARNNSLDPRQYQLKKK